MKKITICFLCILCLVFTLSACANGQRQSGGTDEAKTAKAQSGDADTQNDDADTQSAPAETESPAEPVWEAPTITVGWADDMPQLTNYREFDVETGGNSVRIAVLTDTPVRDYRILKLSEMEYLEDEGFSFWAETLFTAGELTPEQPIVVRCVFYGDLPSIGYSYVDENGQTQCFAFEISGENGSLQTTPISVRA